MKKYILFAAALPLTLLACAGDPNKEANDAHDAELKAQRKQEQSAADDKSDQRQKTAEDQREVATAGATGSDATKDRVAADAKLKEARDVERAKATERLEKSDARTNELKAIVKRAGPKASTASRDALTAVDSQRAAAKRSIDQLGSASNDGWNQAKSSTESQLDTLEGYVKKAGDEVEKFK